MNLTKIGALVLAATAGYYFLKPKSKEELAAEIAKKEQELRTSMQDYLTEHQTRVGLDSAIQPQVIELANLRQAYAFAGM